MSIHPLCATALGEPWPPQRSVSIALYLLAYSNVVLLNMQFIHIINRHKTMCPCAFMGKLFLLKTTYKNELASDGSDICSKDHIFPTNISLLRPFLSLSLTPVSFSADIKRSNPEIKATFLSHVTDGIFRRYILPIYVNTSPKICPSFHPVLRVYTQHVHMFNNPYKKKQ
jgi:hypothetical protein